jgi:hypothetical protein
LDHLIQIGVPTGFQTLAAAALTEEGEEACTVTVFCFASA